MAKISTQDTEKVADLIKIHIPEDQIENYREQLNTVLEAVEVLGEADTKDVPITAQTHGLTNIFREDEPEEGLNMDNYQNRKNFDGEYFSVKRVVHND